MKKEIKKTKVTLIKNKLNFQPYKFIKNNRRFIKYAAEIEDWVYKKKIDKVSINSPIFVSGLARSGTTYVTNLINNSEEVASIKYENLPFIELPMFWKFINKIYYIYHPTKKRVHGDGLDVDLSSADAFDEYFWKFYMHNYDSNFSILIDENFKNEDLEKKLKNNIKKILILNKKNRYLTKGNYNLFRIPWLTKIFPNSKFIIMFRDPISQINSMNKVHNIFLNEEKKNIFFSEYLNFLGHYEFGSNRKKIIYNSDNINIEEKNDFEYFLIEWIKVNKFILKIYKNYKKNIILINNKNLRDNFEETKKLIFRFCNLNNVNLKVDNNDNSYSGEYNYKSLNMINPELLNESKKIYSQLKFSLE